LKDQDENIVEVVEHKLEKLPVIKYVFQFFHAIKLPALEGLTLYDFLRIYVRGIIRGTLTSRASAIAFSFFTAIFPFLLFIIILVPYIPVKGFEDDFRNFLNSILPPQTSDFFFENIFQNIYQDGTAGLVSFVFILSLILMANGVNSLFAGFEKSFHQELTRGVFKQYFYAIGVALILVALLVLTIIVLGYFQIYVVEGILKALGSTESELEKGEVFWYEAARVAFFVIMLYFATATIYYFGTKEGKYSKFFSAGALLTTILIVVFSYLFGIYIDYFAAYNELYGSIGALLIILFYLWLNANLLLLGFELNATIRRLKRKRKNE